MKCDLSLEGLRDVTVLLIIIFHSSILHEFSWVVTVTLHRILA